MFSERNCASKELTYFVGKDSLLAATKYVPTFVANELFVNDGPNRDHPNGKRTAPGEQVFGAVLTSSALRALGILAPISICTDSFLILGNSTLAKCQYLFNT